MQNEFLVHVMHGYIFYNAYLYDLRKGKLMNGKLITSIYIYLTSVYQGIMNYLGKHKGMEQKLV